MERVNVGRLLMGIVALVVIGLSGATARADDVDARTKAQAEALFVEGSALLEAGDTAKACPKLEAAVELTKGEALGGKLVLARCYEKSGRFASAWGLFSEVAARATKEAQPERAREARHSADALAARVHRLEIVLAEKVAGLPGLRVELDGRELSRAAWSSALPVDPGRIAIVVRAEGKSEQRRIVDIPGDAGSSRIEILGLDDAAGELALPRPLVATPDATTSGGFWSGERIAGLVLGVTGALVMGGSGAAAAVAASDYDDALVDGNCSGDPPLCDDIGGLDDARAVGDAATGLFFGGLGTLAVGVIVFATAPPAGPGSSAPAFKAQLRTGPTHARLQLELVLQ